VRFDLEHRSRFRGRRATRGLPSAAPPSPDRRPPRPIPPVALPPAALLPRLPPPALSINVPVVRGSSVRPVIGPIRVVGGGLHYRYREIDRVCVCVCVK